MSSNEHSENLDAHVAHVLRDILAGRVPAEGDVSILTGDVKACIGSLIDAYRADGVQAVRKSFLALAHDRPWLMALASQQGKEALLGQADRKLYDLYQILVTESDPPPLEAYMPLGEWLNIAREMHHLRVKEGIPGVKSYIRALNNLKQKTDLEKRLIQLLSGGPPPDDPTTPQRRIRFLPLSEFLNRPSQQWLIPEVLPRDGLALVYGESGSYKSFLVMDWSFCLATGTPWLGRRVAHGPVAYIAAEGGYGIGKRVNAWLVHHQRFFRNMQELNQQVPVCMYEGSIILQESSDVAQLVTALQEDFTEPPVLVVIDTLSRCSPGADEVSNTDMARVLASADSIRQLFHCTVLIVHHEGKDKERGPRGASALLANVETAILTAPNGMGSTKVESIKAKDAPKFKPFYLEAKEVSFGPLPEDTSLVLIEGDEDEIEANPRRPESHSVVLACLQDKQLTFTELKQACRDAGQKEDTFKSAFSALNKARSIVKIGKLWQVNPTSQAREALANQDGSLTEI